MHAAPACMDGRAEGVGMAGFLLHTVEVVSVGAIPLFLKGSGSSGSAALAAPTPLPNRSHGGLREFGPTMYWKSRPAPKKARVNFRH